MLYTDTEIIICACINTDCVTLVLTSLQTLQYTQANKVLQKHDQFGKIFTIKGGMCIAYI